MQEKDPKQLNRILRPKNHGFFYIMLDSDAREMYGQDIYVHLLPDNIELNTRGVWYREKIEAAERLFAQEPEILEIVFEDPIARIAHIYDYARDLDKDEGDENAYFQIETSVDLAVSHSWLKSFNEGEGPVDSTEDVVSPHFCVSRGGTKSFCNWTFLLKGYGYQKTELLSADKLLKRIAILDEKNITRPCTISSLVSESS